MKSRVFLIVAILSNKYLEIPRESKLTCTKLLECDVLNNKERRKRREISKKRITVLRLTLYDEGLLAVFIDREASLTEEGNVLDDSL